MGRLLCVSILRVMFQLSIQAKSFMKIKCVQLVCKFFWRSKHGTLASPGHGASFWQKSSMHIPEEGCFAGEHSGLCQLMPVSDSHELGWKAQPCHSPAGPQAIAPLCASLCFSIKWWKQVYLSHSVVVTVLWNNMYRMFVLMDSRKHFQNGLSCLESSLLEGEKKINGQ